MSQTHAKYQLVGLGPGCEHQLPRLKQRVEDAFKKLGLDPATYLAVLDSDSGSLLDSEGFAVGAWFGGNVSPTAADVSLLREMQWNDFPILPLVEDLESYQSSVAQTELCALNGRQWDDDRVAADILKLFRLTRQIRQAFISYRRKDAQGVANQLFDALSLRGYLPFLDIASIESAQPVQNVLHERLCDVDLVIFLDSPTAPDSTWIIDELTTAEHLGLGVLQVVWPVKLPHPTSGMSRCIRLQSSDFVKQDSSSQGILSDEALESILSAAESERIQSLGFRRRRVISEFIEQAEAQDALDVVVQPVGPLEIRSKSTGRVFALAIPFMGLPNGNLIHVEQAEVKDFWAWRGYDPHELLPDDLAEQSLLTYKVPVRIIYDSLGIQARWLHHLAWLSAFLPAKALAVDRSRGEPESPTQAWLRELAAGASL